MIWGLVAAKAKQGINAAVKPESINIQAAAKKGIFYMVLIGLAVGLKFSGESEMINDLVADEFKPTNLMS